MKRITIIGHTGCGDYGHALDQAFVAVPGARIVAVADPDPQGRAAVITKTGAERGYENYVRMLEEEAPDIVVIATHEMSNHERMVQAAAAVGAHIYIEKPLAATPGAADAMIHACDRAGVLLIVAHPWRGRSAIQKTVIPMIRGGRIGQPRFARMYGFNDAMGGDQWMIDLYPHLFDFLWQLFGEPLWCQSVITRDGRPAESADLKQGAFGMGLTAGNGIWVHYQYANFNAEFESYQGDGKGDGKGSIYYPFGIDIHGTAGTLSIRGPIYEGPEVFFHPFTSPMPINDDRWEVVTNDPGTWREKWIDAHHRMAESMIAMIEGRTPDFELCEGRTARRQIEMAMGAHESHIRGTRVKFPFAEPGNPFDAWI
jgi:predicted dehydrogenase